MYLELISTILKGTALTSSFSDMELVVHTSAIDSCSLILYSATLPNSLKSSSLLFESFSAPNRESCHLQTMIILIPFFFVI